jgi:hypothetical protein
MLEKTCSKCKRIKPLREFYQNRTTKDGYAYECKKCKDSRPNTYWKTEKARAADRARYLRRIGTPEGKAAILEANKKHKQSERGKLAAWVRHLRKNYGIDSETYFEMLKKQSGGCAICGVKPNGRRMHVDHSHSTSMIRGILCNKCNQAIGLLNENPELLDKAKQYILSFRESYETIS